jgi:hypothetical protein
MLLGAIPKMSCTRSDPPSRANAALPGRSHTFPSFLRETLTAHPFSFTVNKGTQKSPSIVREQGGYQTLQRAEILQRRFQS